jgi:hypothetical protein
VGQTSGLPVAKPPVSVALRNRHPEDALTGRPEVCPTRVIVAKGARKAVAGKNAIVGDGGVALRWGP